MKKSFIALTFIIITSFNLSSQVDIGANPVALLWEAGLLSVDIGLVNDWGIKSDIALIEDFKALSIGAANYLVPRYGNDGFYIGSFIALGDFAGIGFLGGYKIITQRKIMAEVGFGIGRNFGGKFGETVIPWGRLNVGYRFGKASKNGLNRESLIEG